MASAQINFKKITHERLKALKIYTRMSLTAMASIAIDEYAERHCKRLEIDVTEHDEPKQVNLKLK